ncbi:MAG: GDP-mannose 4,6-dehydratase [Pseudomonadota bacterium]
MTYSGKRVLVTGAGGFIGSHLTERLVREGANVRAFLRYTSNGRQGLLELLPKDVRDQIDVRMGDIGDGEAIRDAMRDRDVVFHLGALIAIPYSYINPVDVFRVNVTATQNVLSAARDLGTERVVHTSTSEVYGTALYAPIDEEHPIQAQSPYSASKIAADAMVKSYHLSFDVPVATLRPFNTFGPRQSGRAVIPTIIGQALFSDKIELGSLDPTRDLTFVTDTVAGFLAVGQHEAAIGRVTNVGAGREISIGDLANKIVNIVGRNTPITTSDTRVRPQKSEVFRLICNATWAQENLGWRQEVSLDEGLSQVIEFIKEHPDWVNFKRYEV